MQIDNHDTRLRPCFLTGLGFLILLSVLAGCATAPQKGQTAKTSKPPSTVPASVANTIKEAENESEGKTQTHYVAPVVRQHYTPHKWPSPSQDLWSQIRAGFQLPANDNRLSVRVWTQYYATHTKHLSASLKRAQPFLWHVVQQVKKRNIPTEIALLPIVESGYKPAAKSYAGASGMWQFMPATAKDMQLRQDWWYDGRNDPTASTDAALNYLQSLAQHYSGDWFLALAAYNAGPGRIDDAIAKARSNGQPTDYWDLHLPKETAQYVPQLLALRRIMKTPARFGVSWPQLANEQRTQLVDLPGRISIKRAAQMLNMTETSLRELNPGLRRSATGPKREELRVPASRAARFQTVLAHADPKQLYNHHVHVVQRGDTLSRIARTYGVSVAALRESNNLSSNRLLVGEKLAIPGSGSKAPSSSEPSQTYVVQSGDTLWYIAHRYHVSVASLKRANGASGAALHPGQKLTIPGTAKPATPTEVVVHSGDTLWSIAQANDTTVAQLRRWNRIDSNTSLSVGTTLAVDGPAELPDFYEVESGDSLWSIASRFSMQVNTLRSLNDLSTSATIRPGERLRLQPEVSS